MAVRVSSSQLVGRREELAELRAALDAARGGGSRLAFVAGESGVGKTRLVAELEAEARALGVRVLHGDCVALGEGELAYAPLTAALRPLVVAQDPALGAVSSGAREALPSLLPGLASRGTAIDAEGARARVFEALLELLEHLAEETGLLLVLEDLHWADTSTRGFLRFLATLLHDQPLLVVGTYRADEVGRRHPLRPLLAELERHPAAHRLELAPLTRDELGLQLTDMAGAAPDPALLDRLWRRSEGNPLFAEELMAAGTDGLGALPPTLRDALMLRIERLSPATQELARLVAVGGRVRHAALVAVAGIDAAPLRDALREGVTAQILVVDEEDRYGFRHALLGEAVLDDLLPAERAEVHGRHARALEALVPDCAEGLIEVANHYAAAGDQPAALRTAVAAGEVSRGMHAYPEAAAHFERALALWERVPEAPTVAGTDKLHLLRMTADFHRTNHDPGRAVALLLVAVGEVDAEADPRLHAEVLEKLGDLQWTVGQRERSAATLARAHELIDTDPGAGCARATLLATEARQLVFTSRYEAATELSRRALEESRQSDNVDAEIRALDSLGVALVATGHHDEGMDRLRDAIALARAVDVPVTVLTSTKNLADAAMVAGRLDLAREIARGGKELSRGLGMESRWIDLSLTEMALRAGDLDAARAALPPPARPAMAGFYVFDHLRRAEIALADGDDDRARALLDELHDPVCDSSQASQVGPYAVARAELQRRAGDLAAARATIDDGLARIQAGSEDRERVGVISAAGLHVELDAALAGDRDAAARARTLLAHVETWTNPAQPIEQAYRLTARAAAAQVTGAADPGAWHDAAGAWDALGFGPDAVAVLLCAAEAELAAGDRPAATATAAEAGRRAGEMRARWLRSEVDALARRGRLRIGAGSEDDEDPDADPFGLTDREREVLRLVTDGRSNRAIGAALFMAEKTASVHVSRILAKLEVRSRTEAAAVALRLGLFS